MELPLKITPGRLKFETLNWPLYTRRLSRLYHCDISSGRGNGFEITPSNKNLTNTERVSKKNRGPHSQQHQQHSKNGTQHATKTV